MKNFLPRSALNLILLLCAVAIAGCASTANVKKTQPPPENLADIELECKSANRLGCRHKGYIYPWNAWAEIKGYKSADYTVRDVVLSGNQATVIVAKR